MQGAFAAPWWGMSAANPQQALTAQDLMYQQPVQAPAPPQEDPSSRYLAEMMRMKAQLRRLQEQGKWYRNPRDNVVAFGLPEGYVHGGGGWY